MYLLLCHIFKNKASLSGLAAVMVVLNAVRSIFETRLAGKPGGPNVQLNQYPAIASQKQRAFSDMEP